MTAQLDTSRRSHAHGDPLAGLLMLPAPFDVGRCSRRPCPIGGCPGVEVYDGRLDGCGDRGARSSGCPWATDDARRAHEFAEDIRHRGYPHAGTIEWAGARPVACWPIEQRELWAVGTTVVEFDPAGVRVRVDAGDEIERARRRETPGPRARDADESRAGE